GPCHSVGWVSIRQPEGARKKNLIGRCSIPAGVAPDTCFQASDAAPVPGQQGKSGWSRPGNAKHI
ncbi:MAG: hypothetical protein AVDCRST_MAG59-1889, partial [uncultured Thermomicrobiales bacterium]